MAYLVPRSFWSTPSLLDEAMDDWGFFSNTPSGLSVAEDEKNVYVEAAVPGVRPEDVDITFEKGTLRIVASTKKEEKEGKKFYRRSQSEFSYQISISSDVDMSKDPEARIEDGVVYMTFVKAAQAQPRKISLRAGK